MFAELVVNIEAPLDGTFHYHVPADLQPVVQIGHLVEVEFGRRLAQGIIVGFSDVAPVEETKPIVAMIEADPVVMPWQIQVALWMSAHYYAPLNGCLRLMLPPGLTRWSDIVIDMNPRWEGGEHLTDKQANLISLLEESGTLRGRQLSRRLGKKREWQPVVDQLARRNVIRKASVLDPPRVQPKKVRTAELIAGYEQQLGQSRYLGRKSKAAEVLLLLAQYHDPLPAEKDVLEASGASEKHLQLLVDRGLIWRSPERSFLVPVDRFERSAEGQVRDVDQLPVELAKYSGSPDELIAEGFARIEVQPAAVGLDIRRADVLEHVLDLKGASIYFDLLDMLVREAQPTLLNELYARTGAKISHVRRLSALDLVRLRSEEVWRDPLADRDFVAAVAPELTADQQNVWRAVKQMMLADKSDQQPILLHGVTGSGKTEIYMHAVELALQRGEQAIVLVPEIALTPQTVRRFASRFPGRVAVLHSRLSDGERYDTWRRARQGLFDIVIGPRSALFTPFSNLGVIVVDEEHDASYKHSAPVPPPYYHARETAYEIGRQTGAVTILGSATPDVVTYHRALSGQLRLSELPKRVMGHRKRLQSQADRLRRTNQYHQLAGLPDDAMTIPLPPVQIVDLRQELRAGNRSIFSRVLANAVTETLERGEQVILFMNRRGTASFVICRDCGHVLNCPRCDIPLTYHRPNLALVCHQCGHREQPHENCPQCGSKRIRHFGLGTEEVEMRVQQHWPEARITRWDRDTTSGKDAHEELLARFINQDSDILVGTQMIAKGLDLPLVTLVGVISADVALGLPDFRTGERAFQVLAQVAGRAGRGLLGGRVILQTYQPDHYAIRAAADHDYNGFFIEEMSFRTQHMLPPFRRMAKLELADPVAGRARHQAEILADTLRKEIRQHDLKATQIFGPVPPYFSRVDGRYRWQIVIRSPDPIYLLNKVTIPRQWIVDIDPMSTL